MAAERLGVMREAARAAHRRGCSVAVAGLGVARASGQGARVLREHEAGLRAACAVDVAARAVLVRPTRTLGPRPHSDPVRNSHARNPCGLDGAGAADAAEHETSAALP